MCTVATVHPCLPNASRRRPGEVVDQEVRAEGPGRGHGEGFQRAPAGRSTASCTASPALVLRAVGRGGPGGGVRPRAAGGARPVRSSRRCLDGRSWDGWRTRSSRARTTAPSTRRRRAPWTRRRGPPWRPARGLQMGGRSVGGSTRGRGGGARGEAGARQAPCEGSSGRSSEVKTRVELRPVSRVVPRGPRDSLPRRSRRVLRGRSDRERGLVRGPRRVARLEFFVDQGA